MLKAIRRSLTSIVFDINPWHEADNIVTATLFSLIGLPSYLYRYKLLFDTLCRKKKKKERGRERERETKKAEPLTIRNILCASIYGCKKIYKNFWGERLIESTKRFANNTSEQDLKRFTLRILATHVNNGSKCIIGSVQPDLRSLKSFLCSLVIHLSTCMPPVFKMFARL